MWIEGEERKKNTTEFELRAVNAATGEEVPELVEGYY